MNRYRLFHLLFTARSKDNKLSCFVQNTVKSKWLAIIPSCLKQVWAPSYKTNGKISKLGKNTILIGIVLHLFAPISEQPLRSSDGDLLRVPPLKKVRLAGTVGESLLGGGPPHLPPLFQNSLPRKGQLTSSSLLFQKFKVELLRWAFIFQIILCFLN